jgi:C4-dicarboxylate-specific signal transduction histidine kinase
MSVNAFDMALRKVCDSLVAPCAVFDPSTDALLLANPAFRQEFGALPASRAAFEQLFEPVTPPTGPHLSPLEDIPQAQRVEVFCPRSSRWYSFQWSVLRNLQDNPLTLLNAQNLTERMETLRQQRALQEQLLSSSRAMSVGEMTTTLAHEINQPLATIVNCLAAARTLLGQEDGSPQPLRQALDLALEQAEQAGAVVARIREFVRTREPRREALGLKPLIDHVVQLQQVDAQKHRARILVELAPELPPVLVDRIMIEQVLTNLIRNGIEAMRTTRPTQRTLSIGAHCDGESRVVVRVADRGSGVPACDEAQLFTPFFTTKQEGMGIGLAICRSIVEFHGGQLYFERNTAGGSVFAFTLPQAQES